MTLEENAFKNGRQLGKTRLNTPDIDLDALNEAFAAVEKRDINVLEAFILGPREDAEKVIEDLKNWSLRSEKRECSDILKKAAKELCKMSKSLRDCSSERLHDNLEENDSYKVRYRFLANMMGQWRDLGLEHFPTEEEAVTIAIEAHDYFSWLFTDEKELEAYKTLYEFHADVWRDMQ